MRTDAIACGAFANESERTVIELLLTNLASAVNDRDEIDLVAIGTTGLFVIEVKQWSRSFLKSRPTEVQHGATKLNDKVRRLVGRLRKAGIDLGFVIGRLVLTRDTPKLDPHRPVITAASSSARANGGNS